MSEKALEKMNKVYNAGYLKAISKIREKVNILEGVEGWCSNIVFREDVLKILDDMEAKG